MRPIDLVRRLCPRARPEYLAAFDAGDEQIEAAGITTPRRLAQFLAQALHETNGLTISEENGNYTARRMMQVWPSRFPSIEKALPFAHSAEKLFNNVYGSRMGNGPAPSGDGYRFRGRGILQTTGREAYRKYGRRCGVDFEASPELVLSAEHALKPALAEWVDGGCNAMADRGDIRAITRKINGGLTGYEDRCAWLRKVERAIGDAVVDFAPRSATSATVAEKPKSAASVAVGTVVATASAVAVQASPTVEGALSWVPWAVGAVAIAAVVVGLVLLVRHHNAAEVPAKE